MTTSTVMRGRGTRLALTLVVLLALLAVACGADDDAEVATSEPPAEESFGDEATADFAEEVGESAEEVFVEQEAPAEDVPAEEPAADGGGGDTTSPATPSALTPADLGRSIVYIASVEVVVEDVALAASQAKTAIAGLGGLLFGEDTTAGEQDRTVLEFKVLPEDFEEALSRLEGLGELESQQVSADDVTERVVDLQSRITTAEASVERLRELLVGASEFETIASLEQSLLERETILETLRGQLRTLQDQVSLATIFLTLREPVPPEIEAVAEYELTFYEGDDDGARCPGVDDLELDEGDDLTVCVQVTNTGNAAIGDLEVRSRGLDLDRRDFTFVNGDEPLQPGETVVGWASLSAPARGSGSVELTGVVVDDQGEPLRQAIDFQLVADFRLALVEDDSLPGFGDALGGSWDFFLRLIGIVVVVAGALVPFLWVPVVAWLAWLWWRRRRERVAETASAAQPPPPPTTDDTSQPVA